jgi:heme o synthase
MPSSLLTLVKFWLSLAIAFSTLAGFALFAGSVPPGALLCAGGVFLLAAGAAAFNQYQERRLDALMERTRKRPIPAGKISPGFAVLLATLLSIAGAVLLWGSAGWNAAGWATALLGILNLAWYTMVYTPLKTRSYFAVLAGAVNGAIPPAIGWVAAGGTLMDPKILFVSLFIYIWQVPHFWLLLMLKGDEYRKAGFYSVTDRFPPFVMKVIILVWIAATALCTLFLPLFGIVRSPVFIGFLLTVVCFMVFLFIILLYPKREQTNYRVAFITFNMFMVITFLAIIADQFAL